jgi:hypothetical protein
MQGHWKKSIKHPKQFRPLFSNVSNALLFLSLRSKMRTQSLFSAFFAATAAASPVIKNREVTTVTVSGATATTYPQPAIEIQGFPIHPYCNNTERIQLEKALGDTIKISQQAAQHIYTHGNESEIYSKYFGQAPTAEVIGWYEKLIYGDHEGVLFRCDDIDGNCHQEGMLLAFYLLLYSNTDNCLTRLGWPLARLKRHR